MNLSSLTLSSSSSILNINPKSFHSLLPLSNKRPSLRPMRVFAIQCSTTAINGNNSNFYKMLSLSLESATMAKIKYAYRSLALRYHPDVCHYTSAKEEWTRIFVQLNDAYETLSNPQLCEEYDYKVLGLRRRISVKSDEGLRKIRRWEKQVAQLKRRSIRRTGWSRRSSMRAQRMRNHN